MNIFRRYRLETDDRHAIRNPYRPGEHDMAIYANTLLKKRIPTLFTTLPGLPGHVTQIQNELNRLAQIEGLSGEQVAEAIKTSKLIRSAIIAVKQAAITNGFSCPW
ncbi:MAG: hypothetical protein KDK50_06765 [Chlamydiia bacterium]|nr:hypothetical protein [Chlamydiia bacterium]MCP5491592.1 hypothetical protein [Chlamydiales bacterium]